jgi:hypothetical protein
MNYHLDPALVALTKQNIVKRPKNLKTGPTIDDTILSILAHMQSEDFSADAEALHSAFFMLKQRYPTVFTELTFMTAERFPFSNQFEQVFFRLLQSGYLSNTLIPKPRYCLDASARQRLCREGPQNPQYSAMAQFLDWTIGYGFINPF